MKGWGHKAGTPDLGFGVRECFPQEVMVKEDKKVKRGLGWRWGCSKRGEHLGQKVRAQRCRVCSEIS